MKIEAVTVCIDFASRLKHCVGNKNLFDDWIVVTHGSDSETIELCKKNKIKFICSNKIFKNAKFAKGKAINEGLNLCKKNDWLVQIDADVKLPDNFRKIAKKYCKNKLGLYGMDRFYNNKLLKTPVFRNKIKNIKTKNSIEIEIGDLGAIGYFQMWHSSFKKKYEEQSETGAQDDIDFMLSFKPKHPKQSFKENWMKLPVRCEDVSGFQGHYQKHYYGIRNILNKK